jgi:hypothetical protein
MCWSLDASRRPASTTLRSPGPHTVNIPGRPLKAFATFVTVADSHAYSAGEQSLVIANFQFGRPCAGEGPDRDWPCRMRCRRGPPQAEHPCPGARAAALKAGGCCTRSSRTSPGGTSPGPATNFCGSGVPCAGPVLTNPGAWPEVCAGREVHPGRWWRCRAGC